MLSSLRGTPVHVRVRPCLDEAAVRVSDKRFVSPVRSRLFGRPALRKDPVSIVRWCPTLPVRSCRPTERTFLVFVVCLPSSLGDAIHFFPAFSSCLSPPTTSPFLGSHACESAFRSTSTPDGPGGMTIHLGLPSKVEGGPPAHERVSSLPGHRAEGRPSWGSITRSTRRCPHGSDGRTTNQAVVPILERPNDGVEGMCD